MTLSIIIPFLNSHEIVRRQALWFKKMDLPDDVEILFMDDGSDPPLQADDPPRNFRIHATNDFRPWTSSLARNTAAKMARGDYLFMTDGDYIVPRLAVETALAFTGDRLGCRRQFGVLDEHANLTQDPEVLIAYGLPRERVERKGASLPPHPNNFIIIRKELFFEMGGYQDRMHKPYPHGEDNLLKKTWCQFVTAGKAVKPPDDLRPMIYMFPSGQFCGDDNYNPFGLFHHLSRKGDQ